MAASLKVSELSPLASVAAADLILISDVDVNVSKKVTLANLEGSMSLLNLGTRSIDNLSDVDISTVAPSADQMLEWDGVNSKFKPGNKVYTLAGVSTGDTDLGTFTGDIITDNTTIKVALQDLETKIEANDQAAATESAVTEIDDNVDDLRNAIGIAENVSDMGTFSGSTISDNTTAYNALQQLETAVETKGTAANVATNATDIGNLESLSGVSGGSTHLGTFTGATIGATKTIKQALQALETGLEDEETARTAAINDLIDSAPGTLDTLNELAAALNDDANFSTTVTGLITANEAHIDKMATLTGMAKDSEHLSTFSGSTITDDTTIKAALQELETAQEEIDTNANDLVLLTGLDENTTVYNPDGGSADFTGTTLAGVDLTIKSALQALGSKCDTNANGISSEASTRAAADTTLTNAQTEINANVDDLITLSGVDENVDHLGTFTGSTIADNKNIKEALQALETACELSTDDGDNVNQLVGSTSADTEPASYLFLVVDSSDGSIKVISKEFVETEGSN